MLFYKTLDLDQQATLCQTNGAIMLLYNTGSDQHATLYPEEPDQHAVI